MAFEGMCGVITLLHVTCSPLHPLPDSPSRSKSTAHLPDSITAPGDETEPSPPPPPSPSPPLPASSLVWNGEIKSSRGDSPGSWLNG